jgi:general secretion pathway protein J
VTRAGKKLSFPATQAQAFTLVEVMVTLTILGFILLMIFGVFRLGLSAWEKGESGKEEYQRMRIASQLISQQVKSAIPYKIKSQKAEGDFLAFEGKAHSLKFVSTLSLKTRLPLGLVYAFYEFQENGEKGGRLILYEGRVLNKNFMDEPPPQEAALPLFEGLAEVRFEYYQEENPEKNRAGAWVEQWSAKEEKELPKALRMTLVSRKGVRSAEELSTVILASLPAIRYEDIRSGPVRRMLSPVSR